MFAGGDDQAVERVAGADQVGDVLRQAVAFVRHTLQCVAGVLLAGGVDAGQQLGDGAAGQPRGVQALQEGDPLDVVLGVVALAAGLAGCSDIYFERREHIVPYAGDAMAANRVTQMVDPWPASSANRNIAFNGEKMQSAVERYRQNKVTNPVSATTSSAAYQLQAPAIVQQVKP